MTSLVRLALAGLLLVVLPACSKKPADAHAGHDHSGHKHAHTPPHGGTAVVLGKEAAHLELVRDASAGKLTLYVMDGELENFIRLNAPSIEIVATIAGKPTPLAFQPVANPTTGEKIGDTSQFEAAADWIKTTDNFEAVLTKVEIRGTTFAAVPFNFPKGNDSH